MTKFLEFSELPSNSGQSILNIGAGKEEPLNLPESPYLLVNLDNGYFHGTISVEDLLDFHKHFSKLSQTCSFMVKEDAFRFMERHPVKFDRIVIYRFLEHVKRTDVLYFIYLMATSLKRGGIVDCIVPNYETLANRILNENVFGVNFEAEDIITTYELLNEPEGPHCSVWTPNRINRFFELEKRFSVINLHPAFSFDGRDIYIRVILERN